MLLLGCDSNGDRYQDVRCEFPEALQRFDLGYGMVQVDISSLSLQCLFPQPGAPQLRYYLLGGGDST